VLACVAGNRKVNVAIAVKVTLGNRTRFTINLNNGARHHQSIGCSAQHLQAPRIRADHQYQFIGAVAINVCGDGVVHLSINIDGLHGTGAAIGVESAPVENVQAVSPGEQQINLAIAVHVKEPRARRIMRRRALRVKVWLGSEGDIGA